MICRDFLPTLVIMSFIYLSETFIIDSIKQNNVRQLVKRKTREEDPDWSLANPKRQEFCFTIPHLQALKEQFAGYIDLNGDEKASREEIMQYLHKYNPTTTEMQLDNFIRRRDKDGDGSVDFIPDYLMEISDPDYDVKAAQEWFHLEDTNGDGEITTRELLNIARKVGMSEAEAEQTVLGYYMSADKNDDGKLSWEEYKPLYLA